MGSRFGKNETGYDPELSWLDTASNADSRSIDEHLSDLGYK